MLLTNAVDHTLNDVIANDRRHLCSGSRRWFVSVVVVLLVFYASSPRGGSVVEGFNDGAPKSACKKLIPNHNEPPQDPAVTPNPFRLELVDDKTEVEPGEQVRLRIRDVGAHDAEDRGFKGFILQARDELDQPRGHFILADSGDDGQLPILATRRIARAVKCDSDGDTLTHRTSALKPDVELVWKAPKDESSAPAEFTVTFQGAVARNMQTYWTNWNVPLKIKVKDDEMRLVEPTNRIEVLSDEL